ncbi:MAG TPA: Stf0 family sulfotransferase [Candidatus Binataceae bacterium]|nr:Stf0 family sulfotransferase [Candidatus Binataceae bacterium]
MSGKRRDLLFVVVGAQRTGTNLLREILNTNGDIAMLGEVFSPSTAPAHWANFLAMLPVAERPIVSANRARALLDKYIAFVDYRVRNHWIDGDKSDVSAIGLDIKYNQLRSLDPPDRQYDDTPFFIEYLRARDAIAIHIVRRNIIHCAISAMIAEQRGVWHDYVGMSIDGKYTIAPEECLVRARQIVRDRKAFLRFSTGVRVIDCSYEELVEQLDDAAEGERVRAPGPLMDIAKGFDVPFDFHPDVRLRKAINLPYSKLIANHAELVAALRNSDFADFASTVS